MNDYWSLYNKNNHIYGPAYWNIYKPFDVYRKVWMYNFHPTDWPHFQARDPSDMQFNTPDSFQKKEGPERLTYPYPLENVSWYMWKPKLNLEPTDKSAIRIVHAPTTQIEGFSDNTWLIQLIWVISIVIFIICIS